MFAVLIFALPTATFISAGAVFRALGAIPTPDSDGLFNAMRGIAVGGKFSVAPWLTILLLFVLANLSVLRQE